MAPLLVGSWSPATPFQAQQSIKYFQALAQSGNECISAHASDERPSNCVPHYPRFVQSSMTTFAFRLHPYDYVLVLKLITAATFTPAVQLST